MSRSAFYLNLHIFQGPTNLSNPYQGGGLNPPETLENIVPSGFCERDSLHRPYVGLEPRGESSTPAADAMGRDLAPEDPAQSAMVVDDDNVDEDYIDDFGTRIQVKRVTIELYLQKLLSSTLLSWTNGITPFEMSVRNKAAVCSGFIPEQ